MACRLPEAAFLAFLLQAENHVISGNHVISQKDEKSVRFI
jgi:hypothetical protein